MSIPPRQIDGATVLYFVDLKKNKLSSTFTICFESGKLFYPHYAVIAHYTDDKNVYRFYCNKRWGVFSDFDYVSIEEAITAVENAYPGARKYIQKAHPTIVLERWYLMTCDFPDLNWARLRVFDDGVAEVFDIDGRTLRFVNEEEAHEELSQDEFRPLEWLDEEESAELQRPLSEITPPSGENDEEILSQMRRKY